jgi:hypothetical protein
VLGGQSQKEAGSTESDRLSKGLHTGASIDLEILAFAGAFMFFDPDFTDMDPDPVEHQTANLSRERRSRAWTSSENFTASEGLVKTMRKSRRRFQFPRLR